MSQKAVIFTKRLEEKLAGKWVAFSDPEKMQIVGYADSLKDLSKQVNKSKVIFSKVLEPNKTYAF